MKNVFIIAEAGVNHNGDVKIAEKMIHEASKAGADAVKFQTFRAKDLCCAFAKRAPYQVENAGGDQSQLEMLKAFELDEKAHLYLMECCKKNRIAFLSSPFDLSSVDLLIRMGLEIFKIPSGEITNVPYLEKIGNLRSKVILSTGMADMDEIEFAVRLLSKKGTRLDHIALLHCTTAYPAPYDSVNLTAMGALSKKFPECDVGYSDHTKGIEIPVAAVALGAVIIEKHFTLDNKMKGPDHAASLMPSELYGMVRAIRHTQKALGSGVKKPGKAENLNREVVRKSIVARTDICKGEKFSYGNLTVKRPGTGISPVHWYEIVGKKAKKDFESDEQISV